MPTIAQGLIDFLTAPPLETLTPNFDGNGPFGVGSHSILFWDNAGTTRAVVDTYGLFIRSHGLIPPQVGLSHGYDDGVNIIMEVYQHRVCQVVAVQQLATGGELPVQVVDVFRDLQVIRWTEGRPTKVGIYVNAPWEVDIYWLTVA